METGSNETAAVEVTPAPPTPSTPTTGLLTELESVHQENDALRAERDALKSERDQVLRTVDELTHERDALRVKKDEIWEELQELTRERSETQLALDEARSLHLETSMTLKSEHVEAIGSEKSRADALQRELDELKASGASAPSSSSQSNDDQSSHDSVVGAVERLRVDIAQMGSQQRLTMETASRLSVATEEVVEVLRAFRSGEISTRRKCNRSGVNRTGKGTSPIALDRLRARRSASPERGGEENLTQRELELAERNARLQRKLSATRAALKAHEAEAATCALELARLLEMEGAATARRRRADEARVEQRFARSRVQLQDLARVHVTQMKRLEARCGERIAQEAALRLRAENDVLRLEARSGRLQRSEDESDSLLGWAHGRIDGLLSGQLNLNRNDNDRIALTPVVTGTSGDADSLDGRDVTEGGTSSVDADSLDGRQVESQVGNASAAAAAAAADATE